MSHPNVYDEDYFLHGKASGKSLYENYRWMPDLTIPMCQAIVDHCGIHKGARVLDYGCARGYTVRALRALGYDAFGYDVSDWAVCNADPEARPYMNLRALPDHEPYWRHHKYDWIIAKDVLEHVEFIENVIPGLMQVCDGMFVVVPLSKFNGGKYVVPEYEEDITHCQRYPLHEWARMFMRPGWRVEAAYRVQGVKDNYAHHKTGNGFLTVRRIPEVG